MKILLSVFLLLLSVSQGQHDRLDYYPDQLYVQVAATTPQLVLPTGDNADNLTELVPSHWVTALAPAGLLRVEHMGLLKHAELQRTYRLYFAHSEGLATTMAALNELPDVDFAEQVPVVYPNLATDDPSTSNQWYLSKIRAQEAWDLSVGSADVVVAIVDDGVRTTHVDLQANCLPGRDVADDDNDPNPPASASDFNFSHGTHCAGIAGARANNAIGIAGVSYNTKILPVKCKPDAHTGSDLPNAYEGLQWAIQQQPDIISLSWAGGSQSQVHKNVISAGQAQGIIIVAGAGNSGLTTCVYPACYDGVVAVGATDNADKIASFSNRGDWIDIMSPGVAIFSTVATTNNSYKNYDGTSMATPLVAGILALGKSLKPNATPTDLINCLYSSAVSIDAQNPTLVGKMGAGRVDMRAFLECLTPTACMGERRMTTPTGTVQDGSGPDNYGPNMNCAWLIQPQSAITVDLTFQSLILAAGDTLFVYDGADSLSPVLDTLTGDALPAKISSTGPSLYVHFVSDASSEEVGFSATYTGQSWTCSGLETLTDAVGVFTDGPSDYKSFANCEWLIAPTGATYVSLYFTQFKSESTYDKLVIYDGENSQAPKLTELSGTWPSAFGISGTSGKIYMKFTSDNGVEYAGFSGSYTSNGVTAVRSAHTALALKVYPNPATTRLQIEMDGVAKVGLYSLQGHLLRTIAHQHYSSLPLEGVAPGLYLLQVQPEGSTVPQMVRIMVY